MGCDPMGLGRTLRLFGCESLISCIFEILQHIAATSLYSMGSIWEYIP